MSQGEVSLWIRVRDGFTAGFKAAGSAAGGFARQTTDVMRGAGTAIGGELKSIFGRLRGEIGGILGDIPGARKLEQGFKGSISALFGGAAAMGMGIKGVIDGISERYAELAREIEQTSLKIAAKQEQIISKLKSAKTGESFTAIERETIGEISALEQQLAGAKMERNKRGMVGNAWASVTGTKRAEKDQITQLENAIATLRIQRGFAGKQASRLVGSDAAAESDKAANEITRNQQQAAQTMAEAARDIAIARNPDEGGALRAEADRLKGAITDLSERLKNGLAQWDNANRSALQSLVNDYKQASISLVNFQEKSAKESADAEAKVKEESANEWADLEKTVAKKVADDREKAMKAEGSRLEAAATKQATEIQNKAKAAQDRALFQNRPQTFNERLQGFIERRDAAKDADKENRKVMEREAKLREKQWRGIGLSNRDAKFLKDLEQFRAAEKEAAKQAALAAKAEKHLEVIKDKIEKVLQAAGG